MADGLTGPISQSSALKPALPMGVITSHVIVARAQGLHCHSLNPRVQAEVLSLRVSRKTISQLSVSRDVQCHKTDVLSDDDDVDNDDDNDYDDDDDNDYDDDDDDNDYDDDDDDDDDD
ncbi:hypothetical protein ElyMa_001210900 [Elysia marginata]|uniref:Uncharacterized protein n=1 Tax=Elysia marginata TaxID=1093978 RepID=A0AAV4I650_9GAST|nr:hypothetical protein ElyMa_001210900 [Elysia marginata]